MKGERKLRLVSGGKAEQPPPDDLPFSDEEIAAAEALRHALEHDEDPLALALRAAALPGDISEADLDVLAALALGEEPADLPGLPGEIEAAAVLRAELSGVAPAGSDAALLQALRHAARPAELPAARNDALVEEALRAPLRLRPRQPRVRRLTPITMAALAGVAALAAATALFVGGGPSAPTPGATAALAAPALARARSADDLFDAATPFPRRGQESARIDRIASARAADLRNNRFASWGVR